MMKIVFLLSKATGPRNHYTWSATQPGRNLTTLTYFGRSYSNGDRWDPFNNGSHALVFMTGQSCHIMLLLTERTWVLMSLMYVNYEMSFSWMLTSARFDFPKVYKRPVKKDEQGHVLLFLHSTCTLTVCWDSHNVSTQPAFSTANTQILCASLKQAATLQSPSLFKVFPMDLPLNELQKAFLISLSGLQEN